MQLYPSRLAAAAAAGISKDTWQRVEMGDEVRESTYAKVDRALGWSAGSCLVIADGGEPVLADQAPGPAGGRGSGPSEDEARKAAYEAARAALPRAPIGDIDAFVDRFVKVLREVGELEQGT